MMPMREVECAKTEQTRCDECGDVWNKSHENSLVKRAVYTTKNAKIPTCQPMNIFAKQTARLLRSYTAWIAHLKRGASYANVHELISGRRPKMRRLKRNSLRFRFCPRKPLHQVAAAVVGEGVAVVDIKGKRACGGIGRRRGLKIPRE